MTVKGIGDITSALSIGKVQPWKLRQEMIEKGTAGVRFGSVRRQLPFCIALEFGGK